MTPARIPLVVGMLAVTAFAASRAQAQAAPKSISLFFAPGSISIRAEDEPTLDQASRLYRDGNPIIMVVAGATDAPGSAQANLQLSQRRANVVVRELVARGIPIERFQLVAKGETDPAVPATDGAAELRNRRVDITWRGGAPARRSPGWRS